MIDLGSMTGREPHPVLPLLTAEEEAGIGPEMAAEFYRLRQETLRRTITDPFNYGYEPPIWAAADAQQTILRERYPVGVIEELDLGGNRASKSERAAKRIMQRLAAHPGRRAWCLQSKEDISRIAQQSLFWKYMPLEWKSETGKMKYGATTKVNYSVATGFTDNNFVLPNGSQCVFKFYSVDVTTVEGPEIDDAWADELVTPEWLEFLRYRLVTRNGLLHVTFTPTEGYSQTVAQYLLNAVTLEETVADPELLPVRDAERNVIGAERVPRIQQSGNERARVVYFHTSDNPFGNYPSMKQTLRQKSRETVLMRAYGVPTKASATAFPLFKETVHVISPEEFRKIELLGGTRYHLVDPCAGRNWFMVWLFIDALRRKFVYREWPSYGHPGAYIPGVGDLGEWAVPGKPDDGERGPAQKEIGWGLKPYLDEIERQETRVPNDLVKRKTEGFEREEIFERWIDARYGNARTMAAEESTTLIEQLDNHGVTFLAAKSEKQIFSESNSGSIRLISDALYYDNSRPIDALNQPHLYVLATCPNVVYALQNWTGKDGQKGASKDPIDVLRMAELSDLDFCDETALKVRQPFVGAS